MLSTSKLLLAASLLWLSSSLPGLAAEPRGLINRVGKMEETMYGEQHKEKALHARISDLEAQSLGTEQTGPLAKRTEALEKALHGTVETPARPHTAGTSAKSAAKTAIAKPAKPVPVTTSEYMPPIAPTLDPGVNKPEEAPRVTADKSDIDDMLRQGTAAHQLGNTGEAESIFRTVLEKSPFNSNACFNLGAIAESKGELAAALGNYRTALIGAPNDPQIRQAIADVETQIAQKQDTPFKNPLVSTNGGGTLLQGNATDFEMQSGTQYIQPQQPLQANAQQTPAPRQPRFGARTAAFGRFAGSVAGGALRGAVFGGGSGAMTGALRGATGRGAFGAAASVLFPALHCPICRLF